jgi:hypothetical protein
MRRILTVCSLLFLFSVLLVAPPTNAGRCIKRCGGGSITVSPSDNTVEESHLKAVDAASDEECLTYENTVGDFEWQACNDLEAIDPPNVADTEVYIGTGAGTGAWSVLSGDATMANDGTVTVVNDSHTHTGTTGSATVSQVDISSDTNLAVTAPLVLTEDTLSVSEYASAVSSTGGALAVNTVTLATSAADYDLPDECDTATGAWAVLIVKGAIKVQLTVAGHLEDVFKYQGIATLIAGDELENTSSAEQDRVTAICMEANTWYVEGIGTWADGGPDD